MLAFWAIYLRYGQDASSYLLDSELQGPRLKMPPTTFAYLNLLSLGFAFLGPGTKVPSILGEGLIAYPQKVLQKQIKQKSDSGSQHSNFETVATICARARSTLHALG